MEIDLPRLTALRLARTSGLGPVTYRRLMGQYGSAEAALAAAKVWLRPQQTLATTEVVQREVDALGRLGGTLLIWGEPDYPAALAELPDPPLVLSVLGDMRFLHTRQVAVVGNRAASASGMAWTRTLAVELARAGITITSGLARGIDTVAHEGALHAGAPTIAVVAGGVDHIYPPENAALRERIIEHGAVVSEQPFGSVPTAQLFPRRNRIIAGLSIGTVIPEASKNSGSLITAQYALNYGRDIWAVPGSPSDPRAGGPNWLLKNGATLVENAADILTNLPMRPAPYVPHLLSRVGEQPSLLDGMVDETSEPDDGPLPSSPRTKVYELLGNQPLAVDELLRSSGLTETDMAIVLTELELDGHAARETDGRWRRG